MDTPMEEQQLFQNVTCNIAASEDEVNEPNSLSVDSINSVSTSEFVSSCSSAITKLACHRNLKN